MAHPLAPPPKMKVPSSWSCGCDKTEDVCSSTPKKLTIRSFPDSQVLGWSFFVSSKTCKKSTWNNMSSNMLNQSTAGFALCKAKNQIS